MSAPDTFAVLKRLLDEMKYDNGRDDNNLGRCFWCDRHAGGHYDDLVGFTWHADDCAYLAALLFVRQHESSGVKS